MSLGFLQQHLVNYLIFNDLVNPRSGILTRCWDQSGLDPADPVEKLNIRFTQMATSALLSGAAFYIPCIIRYFQPSLQQRDAVRYLLAITVPIIISITRGGAKATQDRIIKYLEDQKQKKGE